MITERISRWIQDWANFLIARTEASLAQQRELAEEDAA